MVVIMPLLLVLPLCLEVRAINPFLQNVSLLNVQRSGIKVVLINTHVEVYV